MAPLNRIKTQEGFTLLEAMISLSVGVVIILSFTTLTLYSSRLSTENTHTLQATMYVREAIEAVRDLEYSNWAELTDLTCLKPLICHPEISGSAWVLVAGDEALGGGKFTRSLTVEEVYRDQLTFPNEIAEVGVIDPDSRKITATIVWNEGSQSRTETLEAYAYRHD